MPHLAAPGPVALVIQVGGDSLGPIALMHILVKGNADNGGLGFIESQLVDLMLALIHAPAFHKVIAIMSKENSPLRI